MLDGTISNLLTMYHELNPQFIDELTEEPSPLEFMRYVARNRPFVIRRGAAGWTACKRWNARYLTETMAEEHVNVAITPHGNADSVIKLKDSSQCLFVKPYERQEIFQNVVRTIQVQEAESPLRGPVRYAQTRAYTGDDPKHVAGPGRT